MIPNTVDFAEDEVAISMPSLTYKIDHISGRISRKIDGTEAIMQAIEKMLTTDKYQHLIYDWYYGNDINTLIGNPREYVKVELPRMIEESITQDDRILGLTKFEIISETLDTIVCSCEIATIRGAVKYNMEVAI